MQKAEPQHAQTQNQPAAKRGQAASVESPQGGRIAQLEAMMDNSPLQAAQRKKFDRLFGTAQRVEDEEPLQPRLASESAAQLEQQPAPKPNNTGLPDDLKSGIENLSGMSMDNVKVHYNSSHPAQLNALAYAQGADIHVAPGQEKHLPHEAWHVVQQAQGRVRPTMQMKSGVPVNDDRGLEHEADVMGGRSLGVGGELAQRAGEGEFLQESGLNSLAAPFQALQRCGSEDEKSDDEEEKRGNDEEDSIDELDSSEESVDDFEDDPSFVFKESKGGRTYRSGISFYDTLTLSTRKELTKLQSNEEGELFSEPGGKGTLIPLDRQGREVRPHKTKGAKNRQPDIDHKEDFLFYDQAIEELNYPMSPDTREEFREFAYNDPENLQITPHSEHKVKPTTRREYIPPSKLKKVKKQVKKLEEKFSKKRKRHEGSMQDRSKKRKLREDLMKEHKSAFDKLHDKHNHRDDDDNMGGGGIAT